MLAQEGASLIRAINAALSTCKLDEHPLMDALTTNLEAFIHNGKGNPKYRMAFVLVSGDADASEVLEHLKEEGIQSRKLDEFVI